MLCVCAVVKEKLLPLGLYSKGFAIQEGDIGTNSLGCRMEGNGSGVKDALRHLGVFLAADSNDLNERRGGS